MQWQFVTKKHSNETDWFLKLAFVKLRLKFLENDIFFEKSTYNYYIWEMPNGSLLLNAYK